MLSRDIPFRKKRFSEINIGRILVVFLTFFAIIFVVMGYDPSTGIMGTLVKTTFSGLAVLCPTTIAVLYWKKVTKWGCIASIVIGEISVFLFQYSVLPSFGFLSAIWAILIAIIVLVVVSLFSKQKR
jgi:SSS family solute:Na+ symporter